jgi:phenylalanyl-tRNA synthetase alpha chain
VASSRLKDTLTQAIEARRMALEQAALDAKLSTERLDPTLPPRPARLA